MAKILLADDSAFMRNILKNALSQSFPDSTLVEAVDGQDAIEKYDAETPDMVFLDIMMPRKTGLEALKEIKGKNAGAKIVMCTSVGQEQVIQEAIQNGASDFIIKPFKPEQIKEAVSKTLG